MWQKETADLGITGHDMVVERESDVEEILDLQTGKANSWLLFTRILRLLPFSNSQE